MPIVGKASTPLSYRDAGVDIDRGNEFVEKIKTLASSTRRAGVVGGLGGFGALFDLAALNLNRPLLVSGTDGVGTKLKLAVALDKHDTIGIDLVAMCANDVVVQGAQPLFFLDYLATGQLNSEVAEQIVAGIADGCRQAGAALLGGETAEMPGVYTGSDYDLAGFCVGAVEADSLIDGSRVGAGDIVLGLGSTGLHANGYSLVRKLLATTNADLDQRLEHGSLGEQLLTPTRIYVKSLLALCEALPVHAMAHITGGGLLENIPRVLPDTLRAVLDTETWNAPKVFNWLRQTATMERNELLRTFNCGLGMIIIVAPEYETEATRILTDNGERCWTVGVIEARIGQQSAIEIVGEL